MRPHCDTSKDFLFSTELHFKDEPPKDFGMKEGRGSHLLFQVLQEILYHLKKEHRVKSLCYLVSHSDLCWAYAMPSFKASNLENVAPV